MKHTIQFGVLANGNSRLVQVECTCGAVFASEEVKAVAWATMAADIKADLWGEAQEKAAAHIEKESP